MHVDFVSFLTILAKALAQLSVAGGAGLLIGLLLWRPAIRKAITPRNLWRFASSLFAIGFGLFGILLLVAVLFMVMFHPMLSSPPQHTYWYRRVARIDFDQAHQFWSINETVTIPRDEVMPECVDPWDSLSALPPWTKDAGASFPLSDQWVMRLHRIEPSHGPEGQLLYTNKLLFAPFVPPPELERCTRSLRLPPIHTVQVTLRAPEAVVNATDPPATSSQLPNRFLHYELPLDVSDPLVVELRHPWLRNELGLTLLSWHVWTVANWLVLTIVALFADRIRERFLTPLLSLFRRRRAIHDAGFRPRSK